MGVAEVEDQERVSGDFDAVGQAVERDRPRDGAACRRLAAAHVAPFASAAAASAARRRVMGLLPRRRRARARAPRRPWAGVGADRPGRGGRPGGRRGPGGSRGASAGGSRRRSSATRTSKPMSWKKGPSPTCISKERGVAPGGGAEARCATAEATTPVAPSRASASVTAPAEGSPEASAMNTSAASTASTIHSMIFWQRRSGLLMSVRSGSLGGPARVASDWLASTSGGGVDGRLLHRRMASGGARRSAIVTGGVWGTLSGAPIVTGGAWGTLSGSPIVTGGFGDPLRVTHRDPRPPS